MEDISACLPCNQYISKRFNYPLDRITAGKKRSFVSSLAKSFKQLHDLSIYHGDLKESNVMVGELPGTWELFYIDLDRVYFNKNITLKKEDKKLVSIKCILTQLHYLYRSIKVLSNIRGSENT